MRCSTMQPLITLLTIWQPGHIPQLRTEGEVTGILPVVRFVMLSTLPPGCRAGKPRQHDHSVILVTPIGLGQLVQTIGPDQ